MRKSWWCRFLNKQGYPLLFAVIVFLAFLLRAWQVSSNPPGLYWDELSLGYDAWSVATTGRDHHGNSLSLLSFESYGDHKPSGYIYTLVPFFWIFGKHDWVIRAPSVLAGVAIVVAVGQLTAWFLDDQAKSRSLSQRRTWTLIAMVIAAITPSLWHLSRVGFETNLATAYLLWAMLLLLPLINAPAAAAKLTWRLPVATVLFLASFLTYHSMRFVAPLLALFLIAIVLWRQRRHFFTFVKQNLPAVIITSTILALFLGTVFYQWQGNEFSARFQTENIFTQPEYVLASNQCYQLNVNNVFASLLCHRFFYYMAAIAANFSAHFNLDYLFISGESNLRHSPGLFGVYYLTDCLPLLAGGLFLWRQRRNQLGRFKIVFILFWLIIGLLPAAMTTTTPHLLRSFNLMPLGVVVIVCAWQLIWTSLSVRFAKFKALLVIVFSALYIVQAWLFLAYYSNYYRVVSEAEWQASYPAIIAAVSALEQEHPGVPVYIDRQLGRASMYYFWYAAVPPAEVQTRANQEAFDQGEFLSYRHINFIAPQKSGEQILAISAQHRTDPELPTSILCRDDFEIKNSFGKTVFYIEFCH